MARELRILFVGASGTIGGPAAEALEGRRHTVIRVRSSGGPWVVDLGSASSITALYDSVGEIDAVVCTAGIATFGALDSLTAEDFELSVRNKLMGQVELVRLGLGHLSPGGSFTLTSGGLSTEPAAGSSAVSMSGAGVEAFARAAAIDLKGRFRVNVVSPGWVAESRQAIGLEPMPGIWADDLAEYYVRCVEQDFTGRVLDATGPWID